MEFRNSITVYNKQLRIMNMVEESIEKCDEILASKYDEKKWRELWIELISKCAKHITDISSNMYGYFGTPTNPSFCVENINEKELRHNFLALKDRLITFRNNDYNNPIGGETT